MTGATNLARVSELSAELPLPTRLLDDLPVPAYAHPGDAGAVRAASMMKHPGAFSPANGDPRTRCRGCLVVSCETTLDTPPYGLLVFRQ